MNKTDKILAQINNMKSKLEILESQESNLSKNIIEKQDIIAEQQPYLDSAKKTKITAIKKIEISEVEIKNANRVIDSISEELEPHQNELKRLKEEIDLKAKEIDFLKKNIERLGTRLIEEQKQPSLELEELEELEEDKEQNIIDFKDRKTA